MRSRREQLGEQEALLVEAELLDRHVGEHVAHALAQRVREQRILAQAAREGVARESHHEEPLEAAPARLGRVEHLHAAAAPAERNDEVRNQVTAHEQDEIAEREPEIGGKLAPQRFERLDDGLPLLAPAIPAEILADERDQLAELLRTRASRAETIEPGAHRARSGDGAREGVAAQAPAFDAHRLADLGSGIGPPTGDDGELDVAAIQRGAPRARRGAGVPGGADRGADRSLRRRRSREPSHRASARRGTPRARAATPRARADAASAAPRLPSLPPEKGMPRRLEVPAQGRSEGREVARDHPDLLGSLAGIERSPDAGGDLADFGVRTRGFDAFEPDSGGDGAGSTARSRAIRIRRSRSRFVKRPPASGSVRPRGIGGLVHEHARVAMADQLLDQLCAQAGRVGEAVDETARAGRNASGSRTSASRAARSSSARWPMPPRCISSRQRRATRATASAVSREVSLESAASSASSDRVGAAGVEAGVEQIGHRGFDRGVAIDERAQPFAQQRLLGRAAAHENREERIGVRRRERPPARASRARARAASARGRPRPSCPACATIRSPT